ncbi:MAG TPA: hypothetical protein VF432_14950 [Thermoanaerobaculia bacterium]
MANVYFVVDNQTPVSIIVQVWGYRGYKTHYQQSMVVEARTEKRAPFHEQIRESVVEHGYTTTWIINREKATELRIRPHLKHQIEVDIRALGTANDVTFRFTVSNFDQDQADVKVVTNAAEGRV